MKWVKNLIASCEFYKLDGRNVLDLFSEEELTRIFNGAGPDSWPDSARNILSALMLLFEPVFFIHDAQFELSDGTRDGFEKTVRDWVTNSRKIFDVEYPIWTWKMVMPSYRARRTYWYSVMRAGNAAISGKSAFAAWISAAKNGRIKTP